MTAYIGEIRMFGGNFAPLGWMFCQGQELPIAEYDTLYTLIGTIYGGDGQSTFNLPNLACRVPIHMGNYQNTITYQIGEMAGTEQETLTVQQIPSHNHPLIASTAGSTLSPGNALLAVPTSAVQGIMPYNNTSAPTVPIEPTTVLPAGGSQPHDNMQPFLCINFIISLYGIFPTQS
jgi:microcystin-dependent protein